MSYLFPLSWTCKSLKSAYFDLPTILEKTCGTRSSLYIGNPCSSRRIIAVFGVNRMWPGWPLPPSPYSLQSQHGFGDLEQPFDIQTPVEKEFELSNSPNISLVRLLGFQTHKHQVFVRFGISRYLGTLEEGEGSSLLWNVPCSLNPFESVVSKGLYQRPSRPRAKKTWNIFPFVLGEKVLFVI